MKPEMFNDRVAGNVQYQPTGYWAFILNPLPPAFNWTSVNNLLTFSYLGIVHSLWVEPSIYQYLQKIDPISLRVGIGLFALDFLRDKP
jgi:hypothetical protein